MNTPVEALTPTPLQVPPAVAGVSVIGAAAIHKGPAGHIVASQQNKIIGSQADILMDCTYPVLVWFELLPVAPHTITFPL